MFGGKTHHTQPTYSEAPFPKAEGTLNHNIGRRPVNYQEMVTAVKRVEGGQIYTQATAKPNRKILLFDEVRGRHLFPLVRDREIGIGTKYQSVVIESVDLPL